MRLFPLFLTLLAAPLFLASGQQAEKSPTPAPTPSPTPEFAPAATLETSDLAGFDKYPPEVQTRIKNALELTKLNLTYTYGSADPKKGGMDCSGTMFYLLTQSGFVDPPRTASNQYVWVRKAGLFRAVLSPNEKSFELDELKPGDLLFWIGTYSVDRDPPVTHSMLYLGKEKRSGKRVMFGASENRSYQGKKRCGVSVFDFRIGSGQRADGSSGAMFVGYGSPPPKSD